MAHLVDRLQPGAGPPEQAFATVAARLRPALLPVTSILGLLLLWQLAASLAADPRLLPSPAAILATQIEQTASGELPYHLGVLRPTVR